MTAELNKLKVQRGGIKTSATKLFTKIDEAVSSSDTNFLEAALTQLSGKETQIVELDKLIQNEYTDLKQLEAEVESAQDYRDKIILYKTKINQALRVLLKSSTGSVIEENSICDTENLQLVSNAKQKAKVKLPKIHIEKYDGNPENFQEFWSQFKSAIHDNDDLNKIDKFTYLKSLLKSSALNAIQGLSLSDKNYDIAIKIIEDRYGKKEILIRSHINKLLNLSPIRSASNLKDLRDLSDTCEIHIRSLESLGIQIETYGNLLFPIISKLVPDSLVLNYNREYKDETESWNVVKFLEYLKSEIQIRERTLSFQKKESEFGSQYDNKNKYEKETSNYAKNYYPKKRYEKHPSAAALNATSVDECVFCSKTDHKIDECTLTVAEKKRTLLRQGRCFNCLKKYHVVSKCMCKPACIKCKKKHSQYICEEPVKPKPEVENNETVVSNITENRIANREILLQTATILVENRNRGIEVRCLFDLGSQRTFISLDLANELNLKVIGKEVIRIYPFGSKEPQKKVINRVAVNLRNIHDPRMKIKIEALTTETITDAVIRGPDKQTKEFFSANVMKLADVFTSENPKVRLLIGADHFWKIVYGKTRRISNSLVGMDSMFGWIISGSTDFVNKTSSAEETNVMKLVIDSSEENYDLTLEKFWRLDAIGIEHEKRDLSINEQGIIVEEFEKNIKFENNRYQVKLPWNENVEKLENNYDIAEYRLQKLVKRFQKDPKFYERYNTVITKQILDGIVEEVNLTEKSETNVSREYYIPHQAVIREDKTTTKFRVVYDASSHASNKLSLNDCLHSGPNLNPDTLALLLQFRNKPVAFTADIEQAFLQIALYEEDRDAVRFLWIDDDFEKKQNFKTKIFRMTRVLFGATASPFLLAATLKHHIKKYEHKYPLAYQILNSQLYVDDLISGLDSENDSFKVYQQIKGILCEGGFNMRKWKSNSETLQIKLNEAEKCPDSDDCSKVLGYIWNSKKDTLKLEIESVKSCDKLIQSKTLTKRLILKLASKIYDPIGYITPFTVRPKILLQDIWERKLNWDDPLPNDIREEWTKWHEELELLSKIEVPRFYFEVTKKINDCQFHCFVDASKKAYGAVIYIRYTDSGGQIRTSFVCSKSRVAPLQKLTLPRLELMSAVIGSRLYDYLKTNLNAKNCHIKFWSDSMIVLHWIRGSSKRFKTFVQNRVVEIRSKTDPSSWSYCRGSENPADLLTRGETLRTVNASELWWRGPRWLSEDEDSCSREMPNDSKVLSDDEEVTNSVVSIVDTERQTIIDIERFGRLEKLLRITAWVKRFVRCAKKKRPENKTLLASELRAAEKFWIKSVQTEFFQRELQSLRKDTSIPTDSSIYSLAPFIDDEGLLRVKGRLNESNCTYDEKSPIILPRKSRFTELLVKQIHENHFHSGVSSTLVMVRKRFWIPKARQVVKRIIYRCLICQRYSAKPADQMTAQLPKDRVSESPPFLITGIDFTGPVFVKSEKGVVKSYIALFTCAVTRAIHLELVSSLSTRMFMLAFRRFISRRGNCQIVYSDNAKTFKSADKELQYFLEVIKDSQVKEFIAVKGIEWKFIAERAPWWGGFYERLMKTIKEPLRKVLGKALLTFEELSTLLTEIETVVNQRPLTYVGNELNDPEPLTPAHFLQFGRENLEYPCHFSPLINKASTKECFAKRKQYQTTLLKQLWLRWKENYLLSLRNAYNFKNPNITNNLKVNDVVLIGDSGKKSKFLWDLGVISQIFTGRDGLVRSCLVKTKKGLIKRPIQLLYPLEIKE